MSETLNNWPYFYAISPTDIIFDSINKSHTMCRHFLHSTEKDQSMKTRAWDNSISWLFPLVILSMMFCTHAQLIPPSVLFAHVFLTVLTFDAVT